MKQEMMKYTLWLRRRRRLIVGPAAMLFFVLSAHAQDTVVPSVGGPGGEFVGRCPPGKLLSGVELTTHYWVEAIRPLCSTPSVNAIATATTGWYGHNFGAKGRPLVCPYRIARTMPSTIATSMTKRHRERGRAGLVASVIAGRSTARLSCTLGA